MAITKQIQAVYDSLFELLEIQFKDTGGIDHAIFGWKFKGDQLIEVENFPITQKHVGNIPGCVGFMLKRNHVVSHSCEAWSAPDKSVPPSKHPFRKEVFNIVIYTEASIYMATCEFNKIARTVVKAELIEADTLLGRMAYSPAAKH